MVSITESVDFTADNVDEVVAAMARADVGWVNISPVVDPELEMAFTRTKFGGWVSGRGPALPLVTWSPATAGRRPKPSQLGISHPRGNKALDQLAEAGFELGPGWVKRGDHPKNGIVIDLPADVDLPGLVRWAIGAADHLSRVTLVGLWVAQVYGS